MEFYQRFAKYYDEIFPIETEKVEFLKHHLKKAQEVLDLGCATGGYVLALREHGFHVKGLDVSSLMIEQAIAKADKLDLNNVFRCQDMQKLNDIESYDAIYSIGNTIVHLNSMEAIFETFKRVYKALKPNSKLILQMINYERILEKDIHTLPLIQNNGVSLLRRYDFKLPLIDFKTALIVEDETFNNTTQLFPLTAQALVIMLNAIGFKKIQSFDGFSERPFDKENSYQLVLFAEKND